MQFSRVLGNGCCHRRWTAWVCMALLTGSLAGCGPADTGPAPEEQAGLKTIAVLYGRYQGMNRGQPPQSEEELKQFALALKENGQVPAGLELDNVDAAFVSPRDGEPYVFVLDKEMPPRPGGERAIAYEKTGRDGMRQIALSNTSVVDATPEEFSQYVPSP
ncbi:MAG: hypothetical protein R3C10_17280 [Pirellulales bacterium]